MQTRVYGGRTTGLGKHKTVAAWLLIAVALIGIVLSVGFIVAPKKMSPGINTTVGWSESWTERKEYSEDFKGGNGSAGDPYQIANAKQLARMAYNINKNRENKYHTAYYKLVNNIDISARRWDPIGKTEDSYAEDYAAPFSGNFDGAGYVISGMGAENYTHGSNGRMAGLFGFIDDNVTIKNLKLNNANVYARINAGGGYTNNAGNLSFGFVAGYIGRGANVTIENIEVNSGRMEIPSDRSGPGFDLGGIVGGMARDDYQNDKVTIKNVMVRNTKITSAMTNKSFSSDGTDWKPYGSGMGSVIGTAGSDITIQGVKISGGDLASVNTSAQTNIGGLIGTVMSSKYARTLNVDDVTITGTRLNNRSSSATATAGLIARINNNRTVNVGNVTIEDEVTLAANASDTKSGDPIKVGGAFGAMDSNGNSMKISNINAQTEMSADGLTDSSHDIIMGGLAANMVFNDTTVSNSKVEAKMTTKGGNVQYVSGLVGITQKHVDNSRFTMANTTAVGKISAVGGNDKSLTGAISQMHGGVNNLDGTVGVNLQSVQTSIDGAGSKLVWDKGNANIDLNSWQEVIVAPVIVQQPVAETTAVQQENIRLGVDANTENSNSVLNYQWYKNDVPTTDGAEALGNATTRTLTIQAGVPGDTYYFCRVINKMLNVEVYTNSDLAKVTVVKPEVNAPQIIEQPSLMVNNQVVVDSIVNLGDIASMQVKATATGNISFQWYVSAGSNTGGDVLDGQTTKALQVPTDNPGSLYYYVVVTNTIRDPDGEVRSASVASNAIIVIVKDLEAPTITSQPKPIDTIVGSPFTLTVAAMSTDNSALSYQWYISNNPNATGQMIQGATLPYMIPDVTQVGTAYYYVGVTGKVGTNQKTTESLHVSVVVNMPEASKPEIIDQSDDVSLAIGESVDLTVTAVTSEDDGSLSYQWYRSLNYANAGGEELLGETDSTLTVNANEVGEFYYYVEVTNTLDANKEITSTTKSDPILVTVSKAKGNNLQLMNSNLPWIIVIVCSAGVMFAAFIMLVKKSVVEY